MQHVHTLGSVADERDKRAERPEDKTLRAEYSRLTIEKAQNACHLLVPPKYTALTG